MAYNYGTGAAAAWRHSLVLMCYTTANKTVFALSRFL